jgi:hypothetical protein
VENAQCCSRDLIAAALVSPHILHHKQHTIKQAVLSCLRVMMQKNKRKKKKKQKKTRKK